MIDDLTKENEALMAAMEGGAKDRVDTNGTPLVTERHVTLSDDVPAPMTVKVYSDAGTTVIYDRRTGEPSLTNINMLPYNIKKVDKDGNRMFTLIPPETTKPAGTFKCMLHKDHPDRARFDVYGFDLCRKSNLVSPLHVERHMKTRHKIEWETIERERIKAEKEAEIERQERHQNALVAALAGRADSEPSLRGRRSSADRG